MDSIDEQTGASRIERLDVPLAGGGVPILFPLFLGLFSGITLHAALLDYDLHLSDAAVAAVSAAFALVVTLLAVAIKVRRLPDRLRVTQETVEFTRGERVVSRVRLARLSEINEIDWQDGKVLVLSDDRQTLAVIAGQLADPRQYGDITSAITESVRRVDPSGVVARRAVQAARLRELVARRPMRATLILTAILGFASFMAFRSQMVLATDPFPLEDLGALSKPLVRPEAWRIVSYIFIHPSEPILLFCLMTLIWVGGALEKLVGWERMMFAFLAGVVGGAVGHLWEGLPMPLVGCEGGIFGLIGLLAAVTLRARSSPEALRPQASLWLAPFWFTLFFVPSPISIGTLSGGIALADPLPVVAGGFALGLIVGLAMMAGVDVPVPKSDRRDWRGFAIIASACLVVGLVGGVTHHSRRVTHLADDEVIAQALLAMTPGRLTELVQNNIAYTRLREDHASKEAIDIAERLATAAVESSDRRDPEILDTLAVARYRQGNTTDAKELLDEARRLPEAKDEHLKFLLNRHLEDITSGGPLRPDPPFGDH